MTDEQLINGLQNGDRESFRLLVDKYQPQVLNNCHSFVHNRDNAEDIAQEDFIEVYMSVHKFRKEARLSTWLYRISVNKSLNFIRDNKKMNIFKSIESFFSGDNTKTVIMDDGAECYENTEAEEEKIALLHRSISELPGNQKIAFTLSKLDNLPYREISEIMELSLSSVEGLVHRAKRNVQKKILKFYKNKSN